MVSGTGTAGPVMAGPIISVGLVYGGSILLTGPMFD